MKKRIFVMLLFVVVACLTFSFAACNDEKDDRQVPVYLGMTISSVSNVSALSNFTKHRPLAVSDNNRGNGNDNGNNGNHYGWQKDEDIDQDEPFGHDSERIEDAIDSSLTVTGSAQHIYYAEANEDVYVTIHVSNPDNFEILSFTLNGNKYSSYMFESGSDMQNLILKVNVGSESGIVEFTIDAIKYVDGSDIKDVLIDGDQTVRAGVSVANQVTAIVEETVDFSEITLNVKINDNDGLVAYSNGVLKAVLFDGDEIIDEKDLAVGETTVTFDGLTTASLYQYAIVGYYDNLKDGF